MSTQPVTLSKGIHVQHLFYKIDRARWAALPSGAAADALQRLQKVCDANPGPAHPRIASYVNVGGKADAVFMIYAADLVLLSKLHRAIENAFPPGTLIPVFSYLSVTELPEYVSTDDDLKGMLAREGVTPASPEFADRFAAAQKRNLEYQHYRLYPELEDWEIMCFYPMSKRRNLGDNWYSQDFETRKKLMGSHARTGRKFAGRISQLITGSTGLDGWEWGVTLLAHQLDAVKEIVYEMRFDEVTARFGDFGPFFVNLRMSPRDIFSHLDLGAI